MKGSPQQQDIIILKGFGPDRDAIAEAFLESVDTSATTRQTYGKGIKVFLDWIGETCRDMDRMTPPDIVAYKNRLLEENKSPMTVNLYLSIVRKFYKWTKFNNIYPNIAEGITSVRTNRNTFRKMHLEDEEGARLLEQEAAVREVTPGRGGLTEKLGDTEKTIALRNYAMVNLMLRTGLRTIEVSRADIGDVIQRKGKRILLVWGKGHSSKDDFVVLTDEAWEPIRDYLGTRPGAEASEPLFSCEGLDSKGRRLSTRRIQAICKDGLRAIGLDGHEYSAHSLRHTTGTQILLNGGTMFDVQHVLRHANPATSQLYVNTIMEDQRITESSEELLKNSFRKK